MSGTHKAVPCFTESLHFSSLNLNPSFQGVLMVFLDFNFFLKQASFHFSFDFFLTLSDSRALLPPGPREMSDGTILPETLPQHRPTGERAFTMGSKSLPQPPKYSE